MSKIHCAMFVAVMEALEAQDCITGYKIVGQDVVPEWKEGGINRAVQELTANPKPFGLKKNQRAALLLMLPQQTRKMVISDVLRALGLPVS